jgi:hypothetical protein
LTRTSGDAARVNLTFLETKISEFLARACIPLRPDL